MKIISFAYTTAALLAGKKTVTRRYWNPRQALGFKPGDIIQAWDKSPRFGGRKVAEIEIISVEQQSMGQAPDSDFEKEGFVYMCENKIPIEKKGNKLIYPDWQYWLEWKNTDETIYEMPYVVRFKVIKHKCDICKAQTIKYVSVASSWLCTKCENELADGFDL